jgi:hypothetical protein
MLPIIPIAILGGVLATVLTLYRRFMKDWENAKKTGFVCIPARKSIEEMFYTGALRSKACNFTSSSGRMSSRCSHSNETSKPIQ